MIKKTKLWKPMLLIALSVTLSGLILFSCTASNNEGTQNVQTINSKDVSMGPIVHDTLSVEQLGKIRKIQETFIEVYPISLEETITNFKRDRNPDHEIVIWLAMVTAYEKFVLKRPALNLDKKKEVFKLILMRSMQNEIDAKQQSDLKLLTDRETSEIFSYYSLDEKPITVEQK